MLPAEEPGFADSLFVSEEREGVEVSLCLSTTHQECPEAEQLLGVVLTVAASCRPDMMD